MVTRLSILFRPLRVFAPMALARFFLGGIKLAWDISVTARGGGAEKLLTTETVSTTTVILLVVAVQMLLMGMMSESMARRGGRVGIDYIPARLRTEQKQSDSGEV